MQQPLVTVFIAAYNCEKYISECIESIIRQTYKNIEILIVDDGSTDKTVSIIESYNDNRIKLLKNIENRGIPYTRNRGINESKGKYLAIIDADDIAVENRIEKQISILEKQANIDVVASYFKLFTNTTKLSNKANIKYFIRSLLNKLKNNGKDLEIKLELIFNCAIGNPTAMIRLSALRESNLNYDEKYFIAQDYNLWAQISKIGEFYMIPEYLLYYRYGHENITKKTMDKNKEKRKKVIDNIHNDLLDFHGFNLSDKEKIIFNNFFNEYELKILSKEEVYELNTVLNKLIDINIKRNIFEDKVFRKIINKCIMVKLRSKYIDYKHKRKLYKFLNVNNSKIKYYISIVKLYIN